MNLGMVASKVRNGATVTFRAEGQSMTPIIRNGHIVVVEPIDTPVKKGDVVLARVNGRWFLHLVTGNKPGQVQISNNHGHVNGWTSLSNVVGRLAK